MRTLEPVITVLAIWRAMSVAAVAGVYDTYAYEEWPDPWTGWYLCTFVPNILVLLGFVVLCVFQELRRDKGMRRYQLAMRMLGGIVIGVTTYRSAFPVQYVSYFVWWEAAFSNVLMWRLLASVSNLCWVSQACYAIVTCDYQVNRADYRYDNIDDDACFGQDTDVCFTKSSGRQTRWIQISVRAAAVAVVISEMFSFAGAISQSFLWFAVAASLWALTFVISCPCLFEIARKARQLRAGKAYRWDMSMSTCDAEIIGLALGFSCAAAFLYQLFMVIPAAVRLFQDQLSVDFQFDSFGYGISDLAGQQHATHSKRVWTPYIFQRLAAQLFFTSLMSLALAAAPRCHYEEELRGRVEPGDGRDAEFKDRCDRGHCVNPCAVM